MKRFCRFLFIIWIYLLIWNISTLLDTCITLLYNVNVEIEIILTILASGLNNLHKPEDGREVPYDGRLQQIRSKG